MDDAKAQDTIFISKWVDYSNKYGLGYQLTDGSVGVLFNDGTKMILAPDQLYVHYPSCPFTNNSCRRIESIERDHTGGAITLMTMTEYPEALSKKVTLLKYFRNYMTQHLLNVCLLHVPPAFLT
jgi:polo-like kinase 1